MTSIILAGGDKTSRQQYLNELQNSGTELIHLFAEKSSITIKQIQDLNAPLSIAARLPRIVWIEEAGLMTIPAQNALLKMLEEPPAKTSFYLTCTTPSTLLPTIRSRCQTTYIGSHDLPSLVYDLSELKSVMAMTPGDRLAAIVKRDRSESILWISQIESALKDKFNAPNLNISGALTLAKIARSVQNAHTQLLSNCSVSLVTQHFYLTLPHTHSTR